MKCLFAVNARSGRRQIDVARIIRDHCSGAKTEFEVFPCDRKEDLDDIVERARREQYDVVFAVGGDGTVHEVAKRLIGTELALGVVPMGSGNGFARHVGLPITAQASLAACGDGRIVKIDTATVNGTPFVGVMGLGFDALIAHRFAQRSTRGLRTYVKEGLAAFSRYQEEEYEIDIDGQTTRTRAFVVAVANSSQYGNNARIAPIASLQDGLLDVVTVADVSFLSALPLLVRLFTGTLHRSSRARVAQGKRITIRRDAAGPAHLDGEPVDLPETLDVRVVPSSLRVLVPASASRF
ncbi:MAG TPA: diacylglycerol kinase family protein [Thermoanaerobaculia bacterium]|nr:diacylglycerol kinase family protein [Thermoanaerobaculia bacterium]